MKYECYKSANASGMLGDTLFVHDIWNESSEIRASCKTEKFQRVYTINHFIGLLLHEEIHRNKLVCIYIHIYTHILLAKPI